METRVQQKQNIWRDISTDMRSCGPMSFTSDDTPEDDRVALGQMRNADISKILMAVGGGVPEEARALHGCGR